MAHHAALADAGRNTRRGPARRAPPTARVPPSSAPAAPAAAAELASAVEGDACPGGPGGRPGARRYRELVHGCLARPCARRHRPRRPLRQRGAAHEALREREADQAAAGGRQGERRRPRARWLVVDDLRRQAVAEDLVADHGRQWAVGEEPLRPRLPVRSLRPLPDLEQRHARRPVRRCAPADLDQHVGHRQGPARRGCEGGGGRMDHGWVLDLLVLRSFGLRVGLAGDHLGQRQERQEPLRCEHALRRTDDAGGAHANTDTEAHDPRPHPRPHPLPLPRPLPRRRPRRRPRPLPRPLPRPPRSRLRPGSRAST